MQQSRKIALDKWSHLFKSELDGVNSVILKMTQSEASLIPQITAHIISSGGKRMRPILTILASKLCGYEGQSHINLAAAIEFIHTATLLHDDVVDESVLRRGTATANDVWGNQASVLVGDFLLSKSFQIMANEGSLAVIKLLSDASAIITEGEVKQLMAISDITLSEADYLDIIASKTAQLFTAACHVGAIITKKPELENALASFGQNLGVAFQIVDDVLDYSAKQEELGKTIGDDFREGKVTLPIIFAYNQGSEAECEFLEKTISKDERSDEDLAKTLEIIKNHDILAQSMNKAKEYVEKANQNLAIFPKSDLKIAMLELLEFAVDREF